MSTTVGTRRRREQKLARTSCAFFFDCRRGVIDRSGVRCRPSSSTAWAAASRSIVSERSTATTMPSIAAASSADGPGPAADIEDALPAADSAARRAPARSSSGSTPGDHVLHSRSDMSGCPGPQPLRGAPVQVANLPVSRSLPPARNCHRTCNLRLALRPRPLRVRPRPVGHKPAAAKGRRFEAMTSREAGASAERGTMVVLPLGATARTRRPTTAQRPDADRLLTQRADVNSALKSARF